MTDGIRDDSAGPESAADPEESESARWFRLRWRRVLLWALIVLLLVWTVPVIVEWLTEGDGLPELDLAGREHPYLIIGAFVTFDAIIPILPSESLLNAASTLASQGVLELGYIIIAGALGAIVGDSMLYWIARTVGRRFVADKMEQARKNDKVQVALDVLGTTAPLLISAGRFVPGVRFAVNSMMGLSRYPYPRFLLWSVVGSTLWSAYTCVFSWWIGTKLGDWPILSMLISALITGVLLSLLYFPLKRRYEETKAEQGAAPAASAAP